MNTKTPTLLAILIILFLIHTGCDKNDCPTYRLPEATQSGENTIGCLIDDVVMVPLTHGVWYRPKTKQFRYNEETGELWFDISFSAEKKDFECGYPKREMIFSADSIFDTGEVEPEMFGGNVIIDSIPHNGASSYLYRSSMSGISGMLEITKLDKTENIISGIFEFEAYRGMPDDYNPDDKINITKGRFDFNYCPDGGTIEGYSNDD